MKNKIIYLSFVLAGSTLGYFLGSWYHVSGWDLYWEIYAGGFVGFLSAFALRIKEHEMFIAAVIGLTILFCLDYIAGSNLYLLNKLGFVFACMVIGLDFRFSWKPVFVCGMIGGLIGSIHGLFYSHQFGNICLLPGLQNFALSYFLFCILGMALGGVFIKIGIFEILKDFFFKSKTQT